MKLASICSLLVAVQGRKKAYWIPSPAKGGVEIIPTAVVEEEPVMEMVPAYVPPDPVNVLVSLPPPHSKDHVIHGQPDEAPGLPFLLHVESIKSPNWRPVAIVKPPAMDPQFTPAYSFGKEPGPLFDRPAAMNKVAEAGTHYLHFDDY